MELLIDRGNLMWDDWKGRRTAKVTVIYKGFSGVI